MKKNKDLLGGQALIEGVMMKGPKYLGYAVYDPKGVLHTKKVEFTPVTKRFKLLGIPVIRGFVNLVEMMFIGVKALEWSAAIAMPDDYAKQSKYEMPISFMLSLLLSFGLFVVLPAASFKFFSGSIDNTLLLNVIEGITRIAIFFVFLILVSLMPDMKRLFGFHGAEHQAVYATEYNDELTVENVKKHSTLHPRCGTSFLLVVLLVSIVVFTLLGQPDFMHRILFKVSLMPLVAGFSYEFIRLVSKGPRWFILLFLWPGLLMQKITTKKPDDKMIEAAIAAIKLVK